MKKILFLLLICVIKLSAYEYLYSHGKGSNYMDYYYYDPSGLLSIKSVNRQTGQVYDKLTFSYNGLGNIAFNYTEGGQYVTRNTFLNWLKNDHQFLNDWYVQRTNYILNFFYNENRFGDLNHIVYDEYQILYNSDGLAIASIVNGKWAGLFDNDTRYASGKLYDKTGSLQYINGKAVKQMSPFDMINELFIVSVQEIFGLVSRTACYIIGVLVVLVFAAFLFCLDLLHSSLSVRERLGSPWIATFDEKGKRVSKWGKNPNYFYHSSFNGPRNFPSWRDYTDYERKLSDDSSSSNYRKKVF